MTSSQALRALLAIVLVQGITDIGVLVLGRQETRVARYMPYLVSAAAGVLLATACLDLLPEAVRNGAAGWNVWGTLLLTLLVLFCLEALAHGGLPGAAPELLIAHGHFHSEAGHPEPHGDLPQESNAKHSSRVTSLLLGSSLHSGVDGLAIAAAFAAGTRAGWSAAFAVCLHEFPHRLGDYSLLREKGLSGRKASQLAVGSGATAIVGGVLVLILGERARAGNWLLPVSAASFLYIALVDLVPELQAHRKQSRLWWEILCLLGGAAWIAAAVRWTGE